MKSKLNTLIIILFYALALLSIAAGVPKLLQQPQELGFLSALGFSSLAVSVLGGIQILGGAMLLLKKTRLIGASLAALALAASSIALFAAENFEFGVVSTVPLIIALWLIYTELRSGRHGH